MVAVPTDGLIYGKSVNFADVRKVSNQLDSFSADKSIQDYNSLISNFNSAGLPVVSLLPVAIANSKTFFLKRDHHWSPDGARLSANLVALDIKERWPAVLSSQEQVTTDIRFDKDASQLGTYADLSRGCGWTFPNETFPSVRIEDAAIGLLDDHPALTTLIGDSYSKRPLDESFAIYLRKDLGVEVINQAVDGGGFSDAFLKYFSDTETHGAMPQLLIWQFVPGFSKINDPLFYRQAIPAVSEPCTDANALASTRFNIAASSSNSQVSLSVPENFGATGSGYFANVTLDTLDTRIFSYIFNYADGQQDGVYFERSPQLNNLTRFNMAMSDSFKSNLTLATLVFPANTRTSGTFRVCKSR